MPEPTINITNELPKKPSMFANPWFWVVVIAALWIIFSQWKSCGKETQYANEKVKADSFANVNNSYKIQVTKLSNDTAHLFSVIHQKESEVQSVRDSGWKAIAKIQKDNQGLPGRIIEYVWNPLDTIGMAAQLKRCDSCATALAAGSKEIDKIKLASALNDSLYNTEIGIRRQYEQELMNYFDSCTTNSSRQNKAWNESLDKLRPQASLWGGFEATNFPYYTSFGAAIAFQFKNGNTQVSLSGGPILKGGTYGQLRVMQKIKFHK